MVSEQTRQIDRLLDVLEGNLENVRKHADELREITADYEMEDQLAKEPIRTIHHLSCTGGTLFTKCIASMPNVLVLNEIQPFSRMQIPKGKPPFTPTDMIALIRQGDARFATDALIKELFLTELEILRKECWLTGRKLVLRDHSHSLFLFGDYDSDQLTLRDVISERFPVKSVVTTRKLKHAYTSMVREGWHNQMRPNTFEEYERRHEWFVAAFNSKPIFQYEDLVREPIEVMKKICIAFSIPYCPQFESIFSVFRFSGDSGRGGKSIIGRQ